MRQDTLVQEFIKELDNVGERNKSTQEKFRDFCEMCYCVYAKLTATTPEAAEKLEAQYKRVVGNYRDKDVIRAYPEFLAQVIRVVQIEELDFLGMIAAELQVLDHHRGQYFTPMNVCKMMAEMLIGNDLPQLIEEKGYISVSEPCAGSGSMIIAFTSALRHRGYDPATRMIVQAIELDKLSYWMCFIQLTVAGIPAAVFNGNSLSMEMFESAWTPAAVNGFYYHHGFLPFNESDPDDRTDVQIAEEANEG